MKTDFVLTPETHDEMTVIDLLAEARRVALEDAEMEPTQLAVVYNQYAIGILQSDSRVSEDVLECPECNAIIEDVSVPGMGMDPILEPCGCSVPYDELPASSYLSESD